MELVASGIDLAASPSETVVKSSATKIGRSSKVKSRPVSIDRAAKSAEFQAFTEEVRLELDPRGQLERLMVDHVIQNAWQLRAKLDRQAKQAMGGLNDLDAARRLGHWSSALKQALESLEALPGRRGRLQSSRSSWERNREPEIEPNEWPIVPSERLEETPLDPDADPADDGTHGWRDRLVFDFDVSDISPVVKGTWVTVSHVVSLIVDGWSWADVLRSHPELTEDDIRTCIAYAMHEENTEG